MSCISVFDYIYTLHGVCLLMMLLSIGHRRRLLSQLTFGCLIREPIRQRMPCDLRCSGPRIICAFWWRWSRLFWFTKCQWYRRHYSAKRPSFAILLRCRNFRTRFR